MPAVAAIVMTQAVGMRLAYVASGFVCVLGGMAIAKLAERGRPVVVGVSAAIVGLGVVCALGSGRWRSDADRRP